MESRVADLEAKVAELQKSIEATDKIVKLVAKAAGVTEEKFVMALLADLMAGPPTCMCDDPDCLVKKANAAGATAKAKESKNE